jgi:hypothetical protein
LLVREQVRKLVPHPSIGVAPPGGATLVNIQTLLWVNAPADQQLATITLLGHQIGLRIHVQSVAWDFGDGHGTTTSGPERAYDPDDGCNTKLCPGYWGHIYTDTGPMTITATVTWTATFTVDGGPVQTIPGTVTGTRQTVTLTVKQARGVLVDPTDPPSR